MKTIRITIEDVIIASAETASRITSQFINYDLVKLYGIPRGGVPAVLAVALHRSNFWIVDKPEDADAFVDDLIDSGATARAYHGQYGKQTFPLFTKEGSEWYVFPWEHGPSEQDTSADDIPIRLLQYIGEDVEREGLRETPKRFLQAWRDKTAGYGMDPAEVLKVFEDGAEDYNEMVLVRDIEIESLCEHHGERIWGVAHIAYIPNKRIVGLSKLYRLANVYARRLQVQERLTSQIANALDMHLDPLGVGVVIEARHACMESRGICKRGQTTVTSALRGVFKDSTSARQEFLALAKTSNPL